ncbi:MAG TPA: TRAM domain-containing protein [Acidimicrobiales bacterium]|nr:TRAM domain-containing protein [Acidimicrobiales bacterium]
MTTATPPTGDLGASAPTEEARIPSEVFVEVVRLMIVALATAVGHSLGGGQDVDAAETSAPLVGAALGACTGYVLGGVVGRMLRRATGSFERRIDRASPVALLSGGIGALLLGGIGAVAGLVVIAMLPDRWGWPLFGLAAWLGTYAGFQAGARKGEELLSLLRHGAGATEPAPPTSFVAPPEGPPERLVLVDASAAIDGRLGAVAETGFLPGRLAVPRFVIDELQGLADAADPSRRRRGRRALELLDSLRGDDGEGLVVLPDEVPEREEVDAKLVVLAQRTGAILLTTDSGLASVAELQGVGCLSLHRLALSLRPVLVPGEVVRLTLTREGKDPGQGVGFLDDGTMVVVSDAANLIGAEVEVSITSSVQTSRGRMFFASAPVIAV